MADSVAQGLQALEERLKRVEEELVTIQMLLAAQYLRQKGDDASAETQYQRALAKGRSKR